MPNCINCKKPFEIRDKDRAFLKKFDAPDQKKCPGCRLQHRLNFRNERTFYKRKSSLSGKSLVSIYHPDAKFPIYSPEEWWSDKHDGTKFGRDFDFGRGFFEQFRELQAEVPRIALFNINPHNSEYCQQAYNNKNSYLCVVVEKCEDCMYLTHSNNLTDSFDCSFTHDCELCYECLDSNKLYACINCESCQNSSNCINCYDCIGCQNCIGCYGLRNKQYHIMNEAHPKEEYSRKLERLELDKHSKFLNAKAFFVKFTAELPHRANRNLKIEDSTGNYLINTRNCHECFDSFELQDCAYCTWIFNSHDIMDVYGLGYGELSYNCIGIEKTNNCAWCTFVSESSDAFYSDICFHCRYLFGCVGLKNKKYCILNKEYSREEYEKMVPLIIEHMKKTGEWGEFFPVELSPYAYNETAADYYFPLKKSEALAGGFKWRDPDPKEYQKQKFVVPDDLNDVDRKICDEILECEACGKNYKIMPRELTFYRKMKIAVPWKCPDCRFRDRFNSRSPRGLYERNCDKCGKAILCSYLPVGQQKGHFASLCVYCEECYKDVMD